jgi:flagellar basal-body rod protein FlgC
MTDVLQASMHVAGSALAAQSLRMRVVSENLANAQSTGASPGSDPYARKTVTFADELSRTEGVRLVAVRKIGVDPTPFRIVREPGHPSANEKGEVKMPNVDSFLELADLREANRSYQANMQVIKQARDLFSMTIDILKS